MSATQSYALRKPTVIPRPVNPEQVFPKERLHVVPALTRRATAWPLWVPIMALLVVALVVPVVINAQMAVTSYSMHSQEIELSELKDYQADLITRAREAQSPQKLAEKAHELGLVPAGTPGYISLAGNSITPGQKAL